MHEDGKSTDTEVKKLPFFADLLLRFLLAVQFFGLLFSVVYVYFLLVSSGWLYDNNMTFGLLQYLAIGHLIVTVILLIVLPPMLKKAGWYEFA